MTWYIILGTVQVLRHPIRKVNVWRVMTRTVPYNVQKDFNVIVRIVRHQKHYNIFCDSYHLITKGWPDGGYISRVVAAGPEDEEAEAQGRDGEGGHPHHQLRPRHHQQGEEPEPEDQIHLHTQTCIHFTSLVLHSLFRWRYWVTKYRDCWISVPLPPYPLSGRCNWNNGKIL